MLVLLNEADSPVARTVGPWDRLLVRVRASRLDSDLARGASPDATAALALRAQMLIGARTRRDLARGAQRILAAAIGEPGSGRPGEHADGRVPAPPDGLRQAPADGQVHAPPAGRGRAPAAARPRVPVRRDRVRDSSEELGDLIRRLLAGGPVAVRGVALASVLLSDGSGPLYHQASTDDVRARIREAVNALDPAIP